MNREQRRQQQAAAQAAQVAAMNGARLIGQDQEAPKLPTYHVDPKAFEADFHPIGDLVLIRKLKNENKTASGLEVPDGANLGRPDRGQIVKVGPGNVNPKYTGPDGDEPLRLPVDPEIKVGRTVYPMYKGGGVPIDIGDQRYFVVAAGQLCGWSNAPPESL